MSSGFYYKIYAPKELKGLLTVVMMELIDEPEYNKDRFFKDKKGKDLVFTTEEDAVKWLNKNVKEEFIDSDYITAPLDRDKYLK